MNSNVKSLVFNGEEYSDFFLTNVGVRQGVHLYPFLFSLYLNEFFFRVIMGTGQKPPGQASQDKKPPIMI